MFKSDIYISNYIYPYTYIYIYIYIYIYGFPCDSAGKESAQNVGDLSLIPGLGRSPGEGKGYPTPVFQPGEFYGLYTPWGRKESDMTERLSLHFIYIYIKLVILD